MGFWIRHCLLIAFCIILPSGLMLYQDTQASLERAAEAGEQSAKTVPSAVLSELRLEAHNQVNKALAVAQKVVDEGWLADTSDPARMPSAIRNIKDLLAASAPKRGFAWMVDAQGNVLARNDQNGMDENPENIAGHPLFRETQSGYALDGLWSEGPLTYFTGAVPLNLNGAASGAIFIATPIDEALTRRVASKVRGVSLTTILDGKIIATTLPSQTVATEVTSKAKPVAPLLAGKLVTPIPSGKLPFTPLFIDRYATGLAYASIAVLGPAGGRMKWIASVEAAKPLRNLAERQEMLIGLFVAALLLALLFGIELQKSYVSPIGLLVEHLSSVQQRRGTIRDLEEFRVRKPFRRLVKLINMTVKKLPSTNKSSGVFPNDQSSIAPGPGQALDASQPLSGLGSPLNLSGNGSASGLPSAAPPPIADLSSGNEGLPSASPLGDPGLPTASPLSSLGDPGLPSASPLSSLGDPGLPSASPLGDPGLPPASPLSSLGDPGLPPASPSMSASAEEEVDDTPMALGGSTGQTRSASEIRGLSADALSGMSSPPSAADSFPPPPVAASDEAESPLGAIGAMEDESPESPYESTAIAKVDDDLLQESRNRTSTGHSLEALEEEESPTSAAESTMIAQVPQELLQATANDPAVVAPPAELESNEEEMTPEMKHFQETYDAFIELRKQCGEPVADLSFQRFEKKLVKNRDGLKSKYGCQSVRFQVYEKNGKAALKATPIRG
ncbi:MAG: MXAN_5187 C-terminal domain-containing protein [Myxococcota bacterium]|nr:MXAN_5187 C-terminal domain-containing protein [Myxococcota bacterium]